MKPPVKPLMQYWNQSERNRGMTRSELEFCNLPLVPISLAHVQLKSAFLVQPTFSNFPVLKAARMLKSIEQYSKVVIRPDRSIEERELR